MLYKGQKRVMYVSGVGIAKGRGHNASPLLRTGREAGPYNYWIILRKSSSLRMGMPSSRAFFSLEPAFSPTIT